MVLTDALVLINGEDLSEFITSVSLPYGAEMLEATTMGDTTRRNKGGMKTWSMEFEMNQSFAAGEVDDVLFPLVGTEFTVEVRPSSAARGAANPAYHGTGILENYSPLDNSVGELATTSITIQSAGTLFRSIA